MSNLKTILALAALGAMAGVGGNSVNRAYVEGREKQRQAQEKARAKKLRVREEIRARRLAKEAAKGKS